jgi:hypothetical protein
MNYEKRTADWTNKFLKHLEDHHPDLVMFFLAKVFFSPAVDNPNVLYAAYVPLDDTKEFKEIRQQMFHVFQAYYQANKVE